MTRQQREQLIERYLSGGMNGAAEEEFFLEVAVNRELRQELRAYRLVEQALANESGAITSTHTALRAHVQQLAMLSGSEATVGSEAAQSGSASGSSAGGGGVSGGGGTFFSGGLLSIKSMLALVIAVTGVFVVGLLFLDSRKEAAVPRQEPTESFSPSSSEEAGQHPLLPELQEERGITGGHREIALPEPATSVATGKEQAIRHNSGGNATTSSGSTPAPVTEAKRTPPELGRETHYQHGQSDSLKFNVNINPIRKK